MRRAAADARDWAAVERDYRLGQLCLAELAAAYDIAPSALRAKAKAEGWSRQPDADGLRLAAERGLTVAREHRRLLADLRRTLVQVQGALREQLDGPVRDEPEMGTVPHPPALAGPAETVAGLVRALGVTAEKLIRMERQAFGLDRADEDRDDGDRATIRERLESRLARLALGSDPQPLPRRPDPE